MAIKQYLHSYLDKKKDETTLNNMLRELGEYYDGDRAYIFEADLHRRLFNNTYEWCRDGVSSEIDNLQNISIDGMECWFEAFEEHSEFYISSLSDDFVPGSKTYQILAPQGIESCMASPITVNDEVVGFLGIDNPRQHTDSLLLLSIAASTCYSEIASERMVREKEREANVDKERIFNALGGIYASMYFIDIKNNSFRELTAISQVKNLIDAFTDPQECLDFFATKLVLPEAVDEMLEFVDLKTLGERMGENKILTKEFKSTIFQGCDGNEHDWRQICFIDAGRDESGMLTAVLFATQSIHDAKLKEIETKEKLESANKAKTNFLFNMSHDIRTPMNAIIGFRDLLEKHQEDPEKRQDYLDKIKSANDVLLSIINNVLEMTRIEQAEVELDEVAGSVEQYADGVYSMFIEMMNAKDIEFVTELEVEHEYSFCDITKSREVAINLLSNAYKYTNPGGKVTLRIDELPNEREGWLYYRTTVTDNGIGMSEEFLPHIFEEFSREYSMTDAKVEGTGLGMPIVKKLVDVLGGTVEIESKKGVGTMVTVVLPHRIASEEDCFEIDERAINPELLRGRRILLAEDNDLNAEIAMEILGEAGLEIDRAANGRECIDMLLAAPAYHYNLILMDIQMPVMNGYEAAVSIRKLPDRARAGIPIVAMTANAFEEDRREALRCGMDGHLAKPINVKAVLVEISRILRNEGRN
ncbi:MAG: ATP-binding protein [Eubacteriales bacterium]|nr:ATP-binding protein [Eubacteriales bacterium]